jgi:hypothetical protein
MEKNWPVRPLVKGGGHFADAQHCWRCSDEPAVDELKAAFDSSQFVPIAADFRSYMKCLLGLRRFYDRYGVQWIFRGRE